MNATCGVRCRSTSSTITASATTKAWATGCSRQPNGVLATVRIQAECSGNRGPSKARPATPFIDDQHLAGLLRRYQHYFNESRPHQGIEQRVPVGTLTVPDTSKPVAVTSVLLGRRVGAVPGGRGVSVSDEVGVSILALVRFQRPPVTPDTEISTIRRFHSSQCEVYVAVPLEPLHQVTP